MPSTNPASKKSQPGQLEELLNSDDSWTIRKVDSKSRTPIISGIGGTVYGIRSAKTTNVETQFQKNVKKVWSSPSITGDNKPYVWINLTDSNSKKYIKKNDSRTFPIGSVVQDVKRMSKMMTSRSGVFFAITQLALQQQNAFNETRIWNPLSIITATARPGSLGLLSYPTRHIEGAGGGFLGNIVAGFMSSVGLQSAKAKAKVPGIALSAEMTPGESGAAISLAASSGGGIVTKGFVRGETGHKAVGHFIDKWAPESSSSGPSGGFLSKLGSALIDKLKSYIPSTTGRNSANWKIRMEYGKVDVFKTFLADQSGLLYYTVKNIKNKTGVNYSPSDIHYFTGNSDDGDKKMYSPAPRIVKNPNDEGILELQQLLAAGHFSPNEVRGKEVGNKRDRKDFSTEIHGEVVGMAEYETIETAIRKWKAGGFSNLSSNKFYYNGFRNYKATMQMASDSGNPNRYEGIKDRSDNTLETGKSFAYAHSHDLYNALGIQPDTNEILSGDGKTSRDLIFFYFHDLINEKYIPFRATLTGISENTSVNWEDVQYMGRADKLFTYNGFSRELNFGFTVYANSVKELIPMWTRINYLSGLTRPAKYADGSGVMSGFIYPPLIKFRIGDMYIDQPAVIASFGLTIPDDTTWEMTRQQDDSAYKYLIGTHQEISVDRVKTRQLPMKVDISISMRLLEKELSKTGNNLYFNSIDLGLSPSEYVKETPTTQAKKVSAGLFESAYVPFIDETAPMDFTTPFTPSTNFK